MKLIPIYDHRPDIEADLHRFAIDEKRCCQFWGFDAAGDEPTLHWDGPPASGHLLDRLPRSSPATSPARSSPAC